MTWTVIPLEEQVNTKALEITIMCKPLIRVSMLLFSQFSYVIELIMPNRVLGFSPRASLVSLFVSFTLLFFIAVTLFLSK